MPKMNGPRGGGHRRVFCCKALSSVIALLLFVSIPIGLTALAAVEVLPKDVKLWESEEASTPDEQVVPSDQMESTQVSHNPGITDASKTDIPSASIAPSQNHPLLTLEQGVRPVNASPGGKVTIRVPLVINPELTDWSGQLQNLIVTPLPEEAESWPLTSSEFYPQRALPDLSLGARVEAIFTFTVERTAAEGSYALPFGVSYSVLKENEEIQDGFVVVECLLEVELSGTMVTVGAVSSQGLLALDTEKLENDESFVLQSEPGGELTLHLPIINNGDKLTEVNIAPKVSSSLSEFPFVTDGNGLVQSIHALQPGESAEVTFVFCVDEEAEVGRVPLQFTAVYREGERLRESHFVMEVEILGDEKEAEQGRPEVLDSQFPGATSGVRRHTKEQGRLYIASYSVTPVRPVGGETFSLALALRNEDTDHVMKNIQISISSIQADGGGKTESISLVDRSENVLKIQEMGPGESVTRTLQLQCSDKASSGVQILTVQIDYEDGQGKQHQLAQPVTLNVIQPVLLQVGAPYFVEGAETEVEGVQEMRLILPLTNGGQAAIQGIHIDLHSEDWTLAVSKNDLQLQPGEKREVHLTLLPQKTGVLQGEIYIEYINAAGEPVQERVVLSHTQMQKETEQAEREIDENGYWILRDEQGIIIQRIDLETGKPVTEKKSVPISWMAALLAVVFAGGSVLGVLIHRRRSAEKK